jgi:hypothetical protein
MYHQPSSGVPLHDLYSPGGSVRRFNPAPVIDRPAGSGSPRTEPGYRAVGRAAVSDLVPRGPVAGRVGASAQQAGAERPDGARRGDNGSMDAATPDAGTTSPEGALRGSRAGRVGVDDPTPRTAVSNSEGAPRTDSPYPSPADPRAAAAGRLPLAAPIGPGRCRRAPPCAPRSPPPAPAGERPSKLRREATRGRNRRRAVRTALGRRRSA